MGYEVVKRKLPNAVIGVRLLRLAGSLFSKQLQMNLQEFTQRYAVTLHAEPEGNYIKLPIADMSELGYMQQALLNAIATITQTEDAHKKESENSIYWLCKILLAGYPQEELEGLSEWIKT